MTSFVMKLRCKAYELINKGNRYHLTGITVSESRNLGIVENGTAVLHHRNGGSKSPRNTQLHPQSGCLTLHTSVRSCSVTVVSKKLLWTEYMEDCRSNGDEPLMYSQFCYHIQQDEAETPCNHAHKSETGRQVNVDWAGDTAQSSTRIPVKSLRLTYS